METIQELIEKKGTLQDERGKSENDFSCLKCDKKFTQKRYLKRHQKTHTGEKIFGCSKCTKKFTQSGDLKRHEERIHNGEKPYSCTDCDKKFTEAISW